MKSMLPLLFFLLAACSSKPKSPRADIARQQTLLKAEYRRLQDSAANAKEPDVKAMPDSVRDAWFVKQGKFTRRMTELKLKSDSLSRVMKRWEADSILRSR